MCNKGDSETELSGGVVTPAGVRAGGGREALDSLLESAYGCDWQWPLCMEGTADSQLATRCVQQRRGCGLGFINRITVDL